MSDVSYCKSALFTDFYELTMAQGYWKNNMNDEVVFDMFFRRNPFNGGFSVFAGIEPLLDAITAFSFSQDDIAFLETQHIFEKEFLDYLSNWHFSGDIYSVEEGSIVFPQEPLIRIHANLIEAQLVEGLVLNLCNFQSLVATKTARVYLASKKGSIMEFGLRRAQGTDGAVSASRAAFIGGASSTSNVIAGKKYGIPVTGTMAHSWVMSFPSELEAFKSYGQLYPENSVFLIDTYDSLKSGIHNAVEAGKELMEKGHNFGIRLDSGDISYLSREARRILDEKGCKNATISVSNELTEEIIEALVMENAPVDSWGVGTHMVTGGTESSFSGVYKLCERNDKCSGNKIPVMKFSDNPLKNTNPGVKNLWRLYDEKGMALADIMSLDGEEILEGKEYRYYHTQIDYRQFPCRAAKVKPLLSKKLSNGIRVGEELTEKQKIQKARKHFEQELKTLDPTYCRILNPHVYKVSVTKKLKELKLKLIQENLGEEF